MTKEYDQITASHYAAFRPSLHAQILKECLKEDDYDLGLDVGCGTGQSAIALSKYCNKVIGIEPSREMLEKSISHSNVEYRHYNGYSFDFPDAFIDIISFAGSLYYAKSQQLLDEVLRVSKRTTRIIVYDFELVLDRILEELNVYPTQKAAPNYDHQVNFDGLKQKRLKVEMQLIKTSSLEILMENITHVLLSSRDNYSLLSKSFGRDDLYDNIVQKLHIHLKSESAHIPANIYATVYQIIS
ncbi:MAG: class I SAM-dependent methyltransferase [Bacteroidota bacterium]